MGRQRTVDDANFWRSPQVADLTQEDKATLLYLLTSPSSNIIGVYPIVARISAAEMGWTAEQFLPVVQRLGDKGLVLFDEPTSYVWVRTWWQHNSPQMALAPKLRGKTLVQIDAIPSLWRLPFVADLRGRISIELQKVLDDCLSTDAVPDAVSIPYPETTDRVSGVRVVNSNNINISNSSCNGSSPASARSEYAGRNLSDVASLELQKIRNLSVCKR
ncbi:hypothetical protein I5589_06680 [Burkholderia vietnamiensis]|uniref:Uncharacterized protein n=1 Tax=Burkholderia vietnamiensis TaxID=60552 RepID=A0ABS1ARH6_BURVI|nr:hypothetical protein [Burkholderia vietnamiensis]MBJ9686763.1 hypothetical protein [Burkholderia vietnamiensis]